ncbi:glycoside hydrolase family 3 C-terminal domain-containing protein [Jiangella muralis]|uniref:glycoside hydrolase family 3 C-terminal domain-containing protein n=1 Tax=Jiangella muralis TaxID=702383 RepID=UPI00069E4074|nr:glycoside hydrolase family 3 C-terminal domain-containing protein [Jiangella muralis]
MDALLGKLTLEQKVRLLTGTDSWHLPAEPAIGLRSVVLTDGPAGVRAAHRGGAVTALNLPSGTALGASWDIDLARRFGAALAAETRRVGADVLLGPTVNLHRSPLGGRHFEALSEDPLLTSRLAAALVRGVQDGGVGACPKHYVANDSETERFTADVRVSERALRELYLAAFEDTVVEERPWMVMAAYNSVNGTTMTEHPLLADPLCGEWGFDGVVVSDWGAARTTVAAGRARLDLVMPGPSGPWGAALVDAVRAGSVPEEAVDEKVLRLLRLAARVGALDGFGETAVVPSPVDGPGLAREVAAAGMVLVRNAGGELPWNPARLRSVAVIGQSAVLARTQGGGSAYVEPEHVVSPLDGLRAALPGVDVRWSLGTQVQRGLVPLPPSGLTDPATGAPGVRLVIRAADGTVLRSERHRSADLTRIGSKRLAGAASIELATIYRPDDGGPVRLGVAAAGRLRLSVDTVEVIDTVLAHDGTAFAGGLVSPPVVSTPVVLDAGRPVHVVVHLDLPPLPGHDHTAATLTVGIDLATASPEDELAAAVAAARAADAVLVVVGTTPDMESESFDRSTLALPGRQDELVRAVAAANPHTVVAVNAGAPVLLPWRSEVAAVLLTWFGGQELGHALADVLLGAREPGGRLPTTWPAAEADVPVLSTTPAGGVLGYDEGIHVGHRAWLRAGVQPAYPFGFGLGYTTWSFDGLRVAAATGGAVDVVVDVRNTGDRPGKHVVQVYLSRPETAVDRPARWLAGFAVVRADAGATTTARIEIGARAFAHWDGGWRTEPGTYTLHVGSNVADLPLRADVTRP